MSIISNIATFLNKPVTVKSNKYLNFGIESVSTGKRWQFGAALAFNIAINAAMYAIAQKAISESVEGYLTSFDDPSEESGAEDQRLSKETKKYKERFIIALFGSFGEIIDGDEWLIDDIASDVKQQIVNEISSSDASACAKYDAYVALDTAKAKAETEILKAHTAYIEYESRTLQDILNSIDAQESHS